MARYKILRSVRNHSYGVWKRLGDGWIGLLPTHKDLPQAIKAKQRLIQQDKQQSNKEGVK